MKFRFSLKTLLVVVALVALATYAWLPVASIRNDLALEARIVSELRQLGCRCTANPDYSRRLSGVPDFLLGEGVGTSIDFVSTAGVNALPRNEAETQKILELCMQLPAVRGLDLSLATPTPGMISKLSSKKLRILDLGHTINPMTDEHAAAVAKHEYLEFLEVRSGSMTESGLLTIRQLPQLRSFTVTELPGTPTTIWVGMYEGGFTYAGPKADSNIATEFGAESRVEMDTSTVWTMF